MGWGRAGRAAGALVAVLLGAGPGPALAGSSPTTTTVPGALSAQFVPCQPATAAGPCSVEPTHVSVAGATSATLSATWTSPAESATASLSEGQNPWPASLTDSGWILNGTYAVTSGRSMVTIKLAAPAPPPASVRATSSPTSGVSVTWTPPASKPPDLLGYEVTRDGTAIYGCSVDASGPLQSGPCPSGLVFHDAPHPGWWTYGVSTLRYGATAQASDVVASVPAASTVDVPAPPSAPVTTPSGGFGPLPSVPVLPTPYSIVPVPPSDPTPSTSPSTSGTDAPTTTVATSRTLPYKPGSSQVSAIAAPESGPKSPNLDAWAAVALGLLMLALALHAWYLRRELNSYKARHRADPRSPTPTHGRPLAP